jgi:hypothetical protein
MMSRKTLSTWAIVMVIVFGGLVILYPMIFHSESPSATPSRGGQGPGMPPTMPSPPEPTVPPVK